jgi:hypothetical protein
VNLGKFDSIVLELARKSTVKIKVLQTLENELVK